MNIQELTEGLEHVRSLSRMMHAVSKIGEFAEQLTSAHQHLSEIESRKADALQALESAHAQHSIINSQIADLKNAWETLVAKGQEEKARLMAQTRQEIETLMQDATTLAENVVSEAQSKAQAWMLDAKEAEQRLFDAKTELALTEEKHRSLREAIEKIIN